MVTMRIKGGLGNQLFQYASAYAMSKRLNQPLQFDIAFTSNMTNREYRLSELNVETSSLVLEKNLPKKVTLLKNKYINKVCRILNLSKHKVQNGIYWIETREIFLPDFFIINGENIYMDGYFQTSRYFEKYRTELLEQFTPKYTAGDSYLATLEEIRRCNSVAVHVRRGDFKKDNNKFHYLLDGKYYKRAIEYMRNHVDDLVFFWFSDDMEWVNNNFGNDANFRFVKINSEHGDIDELMLMKNCNHIIAANSTFSWWAAWLNEHNNSIKIVPKKPYGMEEMILPTWIKV